VQKRIVGFHQDEERHWVAELECGHMQHVRHQLPWINRPWVVTPEGRARAGERARMQNLRRRCPRLVTSVIDAR